MTEIAQQPLVDMGIGSPTWHEARARFDDTVICWVATVNPNGRPHVMPVLGVRIDDGFYFASSESARKGKNLLRDPACVITIESRTLPAVDLVLAGDARKLATDAELERAADAFRAKLGWEVEVRDGAFWGPSAPTAGGPPFAVFELVPAKAIALPGTTGTDESGSGPEGSITPTRWTFAP